MTEPTHETRNPYAIGDYVRTYDDTVSLSLPNMVDITGWVTGVTENFVRIRTLSGRLIGRYHDAVWRIATHD